jgi:DNA-binding LacI/PurR family transcriptional regulator
VWVVVEFLSRREGVILLSTEETARRPRLDDVAAEVGVSPATVSLVLRGMPGPSAVTRELVLAAAARLGYRPDRAASVLASRRSRSIGVVIDVSNPFHAQIVGDLHEAADRHRYDLVLSTVTRSRDERRAEETLLDSRCEALVLLGPEAPDEQLTALGRRLPVVVVGRPVRSFGVDVVRAADDEGVAQAVEYLVRLGHRRIAYVDGGPGAVAALRRRGYQRAMRRHQIPGESWVIRGGRTESSGAGAAQALLDAGPIPTAVLAFNDRCAMGLIDTLVRAGVDIPGRISVVGYDDSPVARLAHIDLTTVSQNTEELTEHAVTALIERLDGGRTEDREVVVPPRLVIRGTTGTTPMSRRGR